MHGLRPLDKSNSSLRWKEFAGSRSDGDEVDVSGPSSSATRMLSCPSAGSASASRLPNLPFLPCVFHRLCTRSPAHCRLCHLSRYIHPHIQLYIYGGLAL